MTRNDLLRALVAVDPFIPSDTALEAVRSLLHGRRASLEGLLIEDTNLLLLTELPFVRVLDRTTGSVDSLDRERLERQWRRRSERIKKAFQEAATRLHLIGSFRVERGEPRSELGRAARGVDVLVISHARRRWHEAPPSSATYGLLSWAETRTVVVVRESWKQGRTVAVVAADAERDRSTLAVAIELARSEQLPLTVLVPASSSPDLARRIDEIASESGSQVRREELSSGAAALLDAARRLEPLALVVAAGDPTLDEESLSHLLDELPCALVVAR